MNLILHPEAEEELEHAVLWYEHQDTGRGGVLRNAVNELLERMITGETTGSVAEGYSFECGVRRNKVQGFPYSIVFSDSVIVNTIYVLAIALDRRRPNYWRSRRSL